MVVACPQTSMPMLIAVVLFLKEVVVQLRLYGVTLRNILLPTSLRLRGWQHGLVVVCLINVIALHQT